MGTQQQPPPASLGFVWRDDFQVGVALIDSQHRRLVEMIQQFYDALGAQTPAREALGTLLDGLVHYTRYHFGTEQRLSEKAGIPLTKEHLSQHDGFVAKVNDMARRFSEGKLVLSIEATAYLREWLTGHILNTDKQLGRQLVARGVR